MGSFQLRGCMECIYIVGSIITCRISGSIWRNGYYAQSLPPLGCCCQSLGRGPWLWKLYVTIYSDCVYYKAVGRLCQLL